MIFQMKSTFRLLILLFMLHLSHGAEAQCGRNFTGMRINPLGAFASSIPVSIEQSFMLRKYSVVAAGSLIHNRSGSGDNTYNNDGFTISPELRYYFSNDPAQKSRAYAGGWLNYEEHTNATLDRLGAEVKGKAFGRGAGILFGNQMFFDNGFLLDFYIGPGYMKFESSEYYDLNVSKGGFLVSMTGPKSSGTKIRFGFSVGLAF
jgi:hypothetical protein